MLVFEGVRANPWNLKRKGYTFIGFVVLITYGDGDIQGFIEINYNNIEILKNR